MELGPGDENSNLDGSNVNCRETSVSRREKVLYMLLVKLIKSVVSVY